MKIVKIIFFVCCYLFFASVGTAQAAPSQKEVLQQLYEGGHLSSKEKKTVQPHLLPTDHPIKPTLDALFSSARVTSNMQTLLDAGFEIISVRPCTLVIVAAHPLVPGYLFKIYLDDQLGKKHREPGWRWLARRVKSANKIRHYIEKNNITSYVVPKKWIYMLPVIPEAPSGSDHIRKNELLIVERMNLVPHQDNLEAWRTLMTHQHLEELYAIIRHAGGSSYRPDNVAYTKEGTFAFIDTEYAHLNPSYSGPAKYLSPEMQEYWRHLSNRD